MTTNLYCIPNLDDIDRFCAFSEQYHAAFEYNDFFLPAVLDDEEKMAQIIARYKALHRDRSNDTLHGAFLDITVHSDDSKIRAVSDLRVRQSMDIAKELGCKAVIFHTNHIPNFRLTSYRNNWVKQNVSYWRGILSDYPTLQIYMENMFDEEPLLLACLAKQLEEEPRFHVCLDVAHAHVSSTPVDEWFRALSPYIRHLHINDNDGVEDTHHPVGSDTVSWEIYKEQMDCLLSKNAEMPTVLIEVRSFEDLCTSVSFMKEHRLYPFL